ncbi:DNA fragmentation factor subunit alpha [Spea bombifrons]|uniref:DNA fragmentation factor subunit alpha n=1 Tax=Spea bombifrons TaxID=233779 RepID=UPI00234A83C4|nr:DNA fragmentation factor subunit alpha [Spea bombifrons]
MATYTKACVVGVKGSKERHGVAAASLQELLEKACKILGLDSTKTPITLVLEEDGTIVEDEDYFLCLPPNTKFVLLTDNKKWASTVVDGGTAWLAQESIDGEDVTDLHASDVPKWKTLSFQLKENLSNIILMSESDLQTLIEVPAEELAGEVAVTLEKVQALQETLQSVLDRREEERQSAQLLKLFLEATKKEEIQDPPNLDQVDSGNNQEVFSCNSLLSGRIIRTLKEKQMPQLSLSNSELEAVASEDASALSVTLNWNAQKAAELQNDCLLELRRRNEQVQCLNALTSVSQKKKNLP